MVAQRPTLFRVLKTVYLSKTEAHGAAVEYVISDEEQQVFSHVDRKYRLGAWTNASTYSGVRQVYRIDGREVTPAEWFLSSQGDLDDERAGAVRFGWARVAVIAESDASVLVRLGIAVDLRAASGGAS